MANTDKNIIIRPRTGDTLNPVIEFKGADGSVSAQQLTLEVTPADQGTITLTGASGNIFTIADNAGSKLDINGNVTPASDNSYNLGSTGTGGRKWNTVYATLFNGTALEAYYADLAENYSADALYEPGTVLVFGGELEVTVTDTANNFRVAGVVSTQPATLMNTQLEGDTVVPLALTGRVPCKVIGTVEKGDLLVSSYKEGYAMVNNDPPMASVIGKAVGEKADEGEGIVEIVVGRV